MKIEAPWSQTPFPEEFNSYKKFYALQTMLVCLPNLAFSYVYTGVPGSRTDQHVLSRTSLYQNPENYIPPDGYLFGDNGYTLLWWLMIPFTKALLRAFGRGTAMRAQRVLYNRVQQSCRVLIEIAIGVWKNRWRILKRGIQVKKITRSPQVVLACCVLHNVCIHNEDIWKSARVPARFPTSGAAHPNPPDPDTERDEDTFSALRTAGRSSPRWQLVDPHAAVPNPAPNAPPARIRAPRAAAHVREALRVKIAAAHPLPSADEVEATIEVAATA